MTANWTEMGAWVLERITEDERDARGWANAESGTALGFDLSALCDQLLNDCTVKRRIVTELLEIIGGAYVDDGEPVLAKRMLSLQALVFAGRPGYRREWEL